MVKRRKKLFKNPWFIAISAGLLFFILTGIIYHRRNTQTEGDYSPGVVEGNYRIGDDVRGDKMEVGNVYIGKDEEKKIEENLQIMLSIREVRNSGSIKRNKDWDEVVIDVVNSGELILYLEEAEFYCNDKLTGIASLKRVKTEKIDNNTTGYQEYYPKLSPGMKLDDLDPYFHIPQKFQVAVNPGDYHGELTIKIKTTRGNWFSKTIQK